MRPRIGRPQSRVRACRHKPQAPNPTTDYTLTLAKIVELQRQIQLRQLELSNAISLVTERLTEIASASGAAVGILEGKKLRYRAATGLLTLPPAQWFRWKKRSVSLVFGRDRLFAVKM